MKDFLELIEVANRLNDPEGGCPWDVKQNFNSLQKYILEEACELVDAVDDQNMTDIIEELGDLFYVVIFYCKVAERMKVFTLNDVITVLKEKLVRRHPHVFGSHYCATSEDVEKKWAEIKKEEKKERKSALDGIPRSLTILAKTQKVLSKLIEHESEEIALLSKRGSLQEQEIGKQMIDLVLEAEHQGLDAEKILRKAISEYEKKFREWEKNRLN